MITAELVRRKIEQLTSILSVSMIVKAARQ
jgi:hypothetical protein